MQRFLHAMSDGVRVTIIHPGWAKGYITQLEVFKKMGFLHESWQLLVQAGHGVEEDENSPEELKALQDLQDEVIQRFGYYPFYPVPRTFYTPVISSNSREQPQLDKTHSEIATPSAPSISLATPAADKPKPDPNVPELKAPGKGAAKRTPKRQKSPASSANDVAKRMDEEWRKFKDSIHQANSAFIQKAWTTAIDLYREALAATETSEVVKKKFPPSDLEKLRYALALSLISTSNSPDIESGRHIIRTHTEFDDGLVQYAFAVALVQECKYKEALPRVEAAIAQAEHSPNKARDNFLPFDDGRTMNLKTFKAELECLLQQSKYPPNPTAVCRFELCPHERRAIYPSDSVYKEFVRVSCDHGCVITYHTACWKKQEKQDLASSPRDKDDLDCPTPDCGGSVLYTETNDCGGNFKTRHDTKRFKAILEEKEAKRRNCKKARIKERSPTKSKDRASKKRVKNDLEASSSMVVNDQPSTSGAMANAAATHLGNIVVDTRSPWTDECIVLNKKDAPLGASLVPHPVAVNAVDATHLHVDDQLVAMERDKLLQHFAAFLRQHGGILHKNSHIMGSFFRDIRPQWETIILYENGLDGVIQAANQRQLRMVDDNFVLVDNDPVVSSMDETDNAAGGRDTPPASKEIASLQAEWARKNDKLVRLVVQTQQQLKDKDELVKQLNGSLDQMEKQLQQCAEETRREAMRSEMRRLCCEMDGAVKLYQLQIDQARDIHSVCSQLRNTRPGMREDVDGCAKKWQQHLSHLEEKMSLITSLYESRMSLLDTEGDFSDDPVWTEEPPVAPESPIPILKNWLQTLMAFNDELRRANAASADPNQSLDKVEYIVSRVSTKYPKMSRVDIMSFVTKVKDTNSAPLRDLHRDQLVELVNGLIANAGYEDNCDCSICHETLNKRGQMLLTLECNHHFHFKCIKLWSSRQMTCPNCRAAIKFI